MATKIIEQPTAWQPVTIEMTFETPEQLAVWVDIMGNNSTIAHALKDNSERTEEVTRNMSENVIVTTIDDLVDYETWEQLRDIVRQHNS